MIGPNFFDHVYDACMCYYDGYFDFFPYCSFAYKIILLYGTKRSITIIDYIREKVRLLYYILFLKFDWNHARGKQVIFNQKIT